jgi:signal peptide peptidase SppA
MTNKKTPKKSSFWKRLFTKKPRVAVLRLSGAIGAAAGFGKQGLSLDELEGSISQAFELPKVKAVCLQINSPGGSPVQSELIYRYIKQCSKKNNVPVYSFAEDVAASGGYWLLCAGDEVYALQSSIIGSIGVIAAGFGFVDVIKKLGIERRVYTQGENKSILDPFQKEKKEDVDLIYAAQKEIHEAFKDLVKTSRGEKISKADHKDLFSGKFWTGKQAQALGLVDGINSLHDVMKDKYGEDVELIRINRPKGWLKRKLGISADNVVDGLIAKVEERSLWQRFGL